MSKRNLLKKLGNKEKDLLKQIKQRIEDQGLKQEIIKDVTSPMVAAALLEDITGNWLDDPQLIDCLKLIQNKFLRDKHVKKEIKRITFRLNKKGIKTDALKIEEEDSFIPLYREVRENKSYISPVICGIWQRIILLGVNLSASKGIDAGIVFISEEKGMENFILFRNISKKRFSYIKNELENGFAYKKYRMIDIPISYAKEKINEAYDKGVGNIDDASGLEELMNWMNDNVPDLDRHPLYDSISGLEICELDVLDQSDIERLFSHELIKDWSVTNDIDDMIQEIRKLEESPIIMPDHLKREKIKEIRDRYRGIIFDPDVLKKRFEDMAYYFCLLGEKEILTPCLKAILAFGKRDKGYELITDYMLDKAILEKMGEDSTKTNMLSSDQTLVR